MEGWPVVVVRCIRLRAETGRLSRAPLEGEVARFGGEVCACLGGEV